MQTQTQKPEMKPSATLDFIPSRPRFSSAVCTPDTVAELLAEAHADGYALLSMAAYQKGTGFGSSIEVLLAFQLKAAE